MATEPVYHRQKAILVADPPAGPRWIHELKLDGFLMGVFIERREKTRSVRIISRNANDYTAAHPKW